MNYRVLSTLLLPFVFCSPSFAEDEAESKPLSAELSLGVLNTSGNTNSNAYNGKVDIKQDLSKWRFNYILTGHRKKNDTPVEVDGVVNTVEMLTAEHYFGSAQADYKLNEDHRGLFVFASYEENKFTSYDYQATLSAGYTDRLFKTEKTEFNYNIGPGMSFVKAKDDPETDIDESEERKSAIVRIAADFTWDISKSSVFKQSFASDYAPGSEDNTKTRSETSLLSKINSTFSMKLAYIATHNSVVEADDKNLDTETSVSLVYSY